MLFLTQNASIIMWPLVATSALAFFCILVYFPQYSRYVSKALAFLKGKGRRGRVGSYAEYEVRWRVLLSIVTEVANDIEALHAE